jgi:putative tricarboxylic transport membrane protein
MNSRRLDVVTGTSIIAFACFVLAYSATFPPAKGTDFGPSLFPRVVAVMLIVLGALVLLHVRRNRGQPESGTPEGAAGSLSPASTGLRNVAVTIAAVIAYIIVVDWAGFIPTTLVFLFVLMKTYGLTVLKGIAASCFITAFVYVLFSVLLRVTLP